MIVIHCFTEAHHLYTTQQISLRLIQDQAFVLWGMDGQPVQSVADALELTDDDIGWLARQPIAEASYADILGGNVYVCEQEADLLKVEGCDLEFGRRHGRWPNITEVPLAFDDARFLPEQSGAPRWALLLTCWNDAGGSVYYLPKNLWQAARLEEHVGATDTVWNG